MFNSRSRRFILLLTIVSLMLGMVASVSTAQMTEVPRDKTLVIENISVRNPAPENYNPLANGSLGHAGMNQVGFESCSITTMKRANLCLGWRKAPPSTTTSPS